MEIEQQLAAITPERDTLLTVGVFDGVHAGHRHLLRVLGQRAADQNLLTGVVTFSPHPQSVVNPASQLPSLSTLEDRVKALRDLGIDIVVPLSFTRKVAALSAQEFVSLLRKYLKMRGLVVGPDFALGRSREGNAEMLRALGREMNFSVEVVPPYTVNGDVVSSTLIRRALAQGDMRKVTRLMGRHFSLNGTVVSSEKRGRVLGFPTANLEPKSEQAIPGNGIYATITQVDGNRFLSATNIGVRPTFGEGKKLVESHLLDYRGDLYGKQVRVEFVHKLRDEKRFPSPEELKAQIEKDIQAARAILVRELK